MNTEHKYANDLMEVYPGLNEYEALTLAIGMRRNDIFKEAFMVGYKDAPVALEAIAMALGYSSGQSIVDALVGIGEKIEAMGE